MCRQIEGSKKDFTPSGNPCLSSYTNEHEFYVGRKNTNNFQLCNRRRFFIFATSTLTMNFPKANMRNILAILYSVCGFGYLFYVTIFPIPPDNIRIVDTVLGFLLGTLIAGVSTYYFGSSQSSADKNDLLKTANETIASKP